MERAMLQARETLVLKRFYPAAPEKVWRAWIEADALRIWFGQSESAEWQAEMDVRVGGRFRFVMQHHDGARYAAHGAYREVERGRRLSFSWMWRSRAEADEAVITVDFVPADGGTEMLFRLDPLTDPRERDAWRADFKRLELYLKEKT
jgi:uncharacterized protein YndB with AHSA1/START domain